MKTNDTTSGQGHCWRNVELPQIAAVYRADFREIRRGRFVGLASDGAEIIQPIYLTSDTYHGPEERWEPGCWHATEKAAWTAAAVHHEADVDRGIEEGWDDADQLYSQCALAYARRAIAWHDAQEALAAGLAADRKHEEARRIADEAGDAAGRLEAAAD